MYLPGNELKRFHEVRAEERSREYQQSQVLDELVLTQAKALVKRVQAWIRKDAGSASQRSGQPARPSLHASGETHA